MANTIATAIGFDSSRTKRVTRLGSQAAEGHAATYHTFAYVHVNADGSGYVSVTRRAGGPGSPITVIHHHSFGPEGEPS